MYTRLPHRNSFHFCSGFELALASLVAVCAVKQPYPAADHYTYLMSLQYFPICSTWTGAVYIQAHQALSNAFHIASDVYIPSSGR